MCVFVFLQLFILHINWYLCGCSLLAYLLCVVAVSDLSDSLIALVSGRSIEAVSLTLCWVETIFMFYCESLCCLGACVSII